MSRFDLLIEIERLRLKMITLASEGAVYAKVLEVSQQLDNLIVMYHKTAA